MTGRRDSRLSESSRRTWLYAALTLAVLAWPATWYAFSNVEVGSAIENVELTSISGETHSLLGVADANLFVFFNPENENSLDVIRRLAELEGELSERSIHWRAIVSDRADPEFVADFIEESGLFMPVLVDVDDQLYGDLGVRLYPAIGITDFDGLLTAYLPFTKINYMASVRGHLLHTLGEISEDELAAIIDPPKVELGGNGTVAKRNLRMAEMLLKAGKKEKALETALGAIELAPELADGYALAGSILAGSGECDDAAPHIQEALRIDPENEISLAAQAACTAE